MPAISSARETTPTEFLPTTAGLWRDRRALAPAWGPSTLVGREEIISRLETSILSGLTLRNRVAVSILGPRGSGSSTVAAHLVATAKNRLTRPGSKGTPLLLRIDASACRSPSALVSALFREIDPLYDGRGASTEFGALLLVRRLRTLRRSAILWIDQVGAKASHVDRVLRCLAHPERLLPEGPAGLPTMLVVTSGERNPFPEDPSVVRADLAPLSMRDMCRAITARANLAFNTSPPTDTVEAIARLSVAHGWGLSMVGEFLAEAGRRAEARGALGVEAEDVALPAQVPRRGADAEGFAAAILEVLQEARGPISVGELRRRVEARCAELGLRAPTQARLWRHLVALERKGVVRREVRMGGTGGSRTEVCLNEMSSPGR